MNDHDLTMEMWCDNERLSGLTDVKHCGPIVNTHCMWAAVSSQTG